MQKLEERIGYRFRDRELLRTALTHSSYANESRGADCQSYERLEFLGDSILGYVTAEFLYRHEPRLPEGRMTRLRAELVCEQSLHRAALRLGLGEDMRLGRGEEHSGGRERPSILADMVESVIIMAQILQGAEIGESHRSADYKTELQELVQRKANRHIAYELIGESGPDHNKLFSFRVTVNGESVGEGSGRTKKEAEQMAACEALRKLRA